MTNQKLFSHRPTPDGQSSGGGQPGPFLPLDSALPVPNMFLHLSFNKRQTITVKVKIGKKESRRITNTRTAVQSSGEMLDILSTQLMEDVAAQEGDIENILMQPIPVPSNNPSIVGGRELPPTQAGGSPFPVSLPSQLASLELSHKAGNNPARSGSSLSSGGPRKKRKHEEEEEVSFSLHTEEDPQRLVSTAALPDDLYATELPAPNFSNASVEPLAMFEQPSLPTPTTVPTIPSQTTQPDASAQSALNHVHIMQMQQKGALFVVIE